MLAIRVARLFDGVSARLVDRPCVLVESGRIVGVLADGAPPPAGATIIDLATATLLPGMVDAHVHLAFNASPDPVGWLVSASEDELLGAMRQAGLAHLAAGVTTVRDLGDKDYLALRLRDELARDPAAGPHLLAAGPPITTTRGHCWYLGGEADGVAGIRAAVRARAERGVDVVKVMATGGELTPGTHSHVPQYEVAELRAAAEEAHRHGLPITAHAHGAAGIANAVAAGFDMVEHCSFFTADGAEADQQVIDAIVRAGVVVSATLGVLPGLPVPPRIASRLPQIATVMRRIHEAGATMICGSDGGIGPPKPHGLLPYSAAHLVDVLSAPPVEALRAVTSTAAQACRVGDRKGRIAAGYDADLLAVDGDPTVDIAALRRVTAVFRAGVQVGA